MDAYFTIEKDVNPLTLKDIAKLRSDNYKAVVKRMFVEYKILPNT